MKLQANQKKYLAAGGLVVVLIVVFILGKMQGRTEKEQREIDVQVNIKDGNGQTVAYDPNELLTRLHKGLTTTYLWGISERCDALEELYNLDAARFMAAVKAYEEKYGVSIVVHMNACYRSCFIQSGQVDSFQAIKQRINHLKDTIH